MKTHPALVLIPVICVFACNRPATAPTSSGVSSGTSPSPAPSSYTPRIGVGVSTGSRTCIAIHNGDLTNGAAVTLIEPAAPPKYVPATIAGVAQQACPVTQNLDTTVSNYNVTVQGPIDKLVPLIAVVGTPVVSINSNNVAQSDLDQSGHPISFRACSADNGVHLTVWSGNPLSSTLLWHGFYYESGNPGVGPSCTPAEMPAS